MNRTTPFATARSSFKPAIQYLSNLASSPSHKALRRRSSSTSLDGLDIEEIPNFTDSPRTYKMPHSSRGSASSAELQTSSFPLIDLSRSSSPYPRSRSAAQSEDEDDDYEPTSSIQPLVSSHRAPRQRNWKSYFQQGGLGQFFFGTWLGWQIYVGLLVLWVGGCSIGLLIMNRLVLQTGVYKFPYPLATTYFQLLLTHILLVGFASLTRGLSSPLKMIGLGALVAPSLPVSTANSNFRNIKSGSSWVRIYRWLLSGSGGIAGGGLFEFNRRTARHVLPLALLYIGKVVLSNLSFAYAPLALYQLARIGIVPLSLLFTAVLTRETHSVPTLSAALIATINLLVASVSHERVTWECIVAGVCSAFFVALYPIILLRTYRLLATELLPQGGDVLTGFPAVSGDETPTSREETRAYWQTLHYTSLLSILVLSPIFFLSGEVGNILSNCYFLDVPFFWFLAVCGGIGSWAVFSSTLLLAKATSPLSVTFLGVPRSSLQLVFLSRFKMAPHSWVGILICWISCVWYLLTKRSEGRQLDRLRLEGR